MGGPGLITWTASWARLPGICLVHPESTFSLDFFPREFLDINAQVLKFVPLLVEHGSLKEKHLHHIGWGHRRKEEVDDKVGNSGQEPPRSLTSSSLLLLSLSASDWSQESHSQRLVQLEQLGEVQTYSCLARSTPANSEPRSQEFELKRL